MEFFESIRITSFDDSSSGPSGHLSLVRMVFRLSECAPSGWSSYFNNSWNQHIYMKKRNASVSGDRLEIICMPDEVESHHIPELNKVIAETNEKYGMFAAEQNKIRKRMADDENRQRDELAGLKARLKFD